MASSQGQTCGHLSIITRSRDDKRFYVDVGMYKYSHVYHSSTKATTIMFTCDSIV